MTDVKIALLLVRSSNLVMIPITVMTTPDRWSRWLETSTIQSAGTQWHIRPRLMQSVRLHVATQNNAHITPHVRLDEERGIASTCLLGMDGGQMKDVMMQDGMTTGRHMEHGQANVFPVGPGEVFRTGIVCCDCGLVHLMEIERRNDNVVVRWWRDDDATNDFREKSAGERAGIMSSEWVGAAFERVVDSPNK